MTGLPPDLLGATRMLGTATAIVRIVAGGLPVLYSGVESALRLALFRSYVIIQVEKPAMPADQPSASPPTSSAGPGSTSPPPSTSRLPAAKATLTRRLAVSGKLIDCTGLDNCRDIVGRRWSPSFQVTNCSGTRCTLAYPEEWSSPITITFDGQKWVGSGTLKPEIAFTCDGAPVRSPFTLELAVTSGKPVGGAWVADTLRGSLLETAPATAKCPAVRFTWRLSARALAG